MKESWRETEKEIGEAKEAWEKNEIEKEGKKQVGGGKIKGGERKK